LRLLTPVSIRQIVTALVFLTSEKRVHAWIKTLAETLYVDLGSDPKYTW